MQALEDNPVYPDPIMFVHNVEIGGFQNFDCDHETIYNCELLCDTGLIIGQFREDLSDARADEQTFQADRLTSLGHDVLAKLNDTNVWTRIKDAATTAKSIAEFLAVFAPFFPMEWIDSLARKILAQN